MKSTIKIEKIEYAGVKLEGVELSQEYTSKECVELLYAGKNFAKQIIKELPEMLEDMEVAFNKFNEIDKRVEEKESTEAEDKMPAEIKEFLKHVGIKPGHVKVVRREF